MQDKTEHTVFRCEVGVHHDDVTHWQMDEVAVETPVALVYNILPHAVMMVTPSDLEDFALGFSLTEGIIQHIDDVNHVHVQQVENGTTVRLQITDDCFDKLRDMKRNIVGRTGCGLCGVETLQQAIRPIPPVEAVDVADAVIQKALAALKQHQALQQITGATHAAGWCDLEGNIVMVREDVGRHNALDKLIGAHKKAGLSAQQGFVIVTSRASYEMVQKSALAGFGCLVAVSAPTSLAIEQARQANIKLVGFARAGRHIIYHNPVDQQQADRNAI